MKNGTTRTEKIADELFAMIRDEGYSPGERLPTEPELMARFSVGRNTLREALKALVSRNVITIRQGAGTFVNERPGLTDDPLGFSLVEDREKLMNDLFQVLLILEPSIAALSAQNSTDEDIAALRQIAEQIRCDGNSPELEAAFHTKLAESTHNLAMEHLTPVIASGIRFYAESFTQNPFGADFYDDMIRFIENRQSVDASSEMQHHLLFALHYYKKKKK